MTQPPLASTGSLILVAGDPVPVTRSELLMLGTFRLVEWNCQRAVFRKVDGVDPGHVYAALSEYRKADADTPRIDYRRLILQYIGSSLGPNCSEQLEARGEVLRRIGFPKLASLETWELAERLHSMGIRALNGETLADDPDDRSSDL